MGLEIVSWTAHAPPTRLFDSLPNFARSLSRTKRSRSHHEATFFSSNNRAGASDALSNLSTQTGVSASTGSVCTPAAPTRLLLPVTQPPQVNPMIANAAAPLTPHGGLDRGLGFHGVSSFDAISGRQRRRLSWHEQTRKVLISSSSPGNQIRQRARSCGSDGSNRCADQGREGPRAVSSHDCRAMVMPRSRRCSCWGVRQALGPRSGADDWSDSQRMSPRFPAICIALPRPPLIERRQGRERRSRPPAEAPRPKTGK